jgi:hypothetical protein
MMESNAFAASCDWIGGKNVTGVLKKWRAQITKIIK